MNPEVLSEAEMILASASYVITFVNEEPGGTIVKLLNEEAMKK